MFVIHWNSPDTLALSVRSLRTTEGADIALTVIDNASDRALWRRVEGLDVLDPSEVVNLPSNVGFAGAANLAWRRARAEGAEWFVVAAHDAVVRPDTLEVMAAVAASASDAGVVGPVRYDSGFVHPVSQGAFWVEGQGARDVSMDPPWFGGSPYREVDWIPGALMLLRTSCLDEIGGFDERLFAYVEDVDLCLRARDAGFRIYVARDAWALEQGYTLETSARVFLIARNTLALIRRRSGERSFARACIRTMKRALRAGVGSIAPGRSSQQRKRSWQFALGQVRAVPAALLTGKGEAPSSALRPAEPGGGFRATVSVVIPTWMRSEFLERCLDGLELQTHPPDEVLVVGRDEDEEARRVAERRAESIVGLRWIGGAAPGHVKPVISGLSQVKGDIVAFLDDDVVPEREWLQHLIEPFADSRVACVGGRVVTEGFRGKVHADAGRIRWYGKHIGNVGQRVVPEPIVVAGVMEGNWAWRSDVIRRLEFDRRLDFDDAVMYGLDLTLQASRAGLKTMYTSSARVENALAPRDPGLDRQDRLRRQFTYNRNYTIIALSRFTGLQRLAFVVWWFFVGERAAYGVATGVLDLLREGSGIWPQVRVSFRGKLEGVRVWLRR